MAYIIKISPTGQLQYVWDGSIGDWDDITNKPSSSTADIDDAVSKKHSQNTDTILKGAGAVLDQSQLSDDNGIAFDYIGGNNQWSQTFTAGVNGDLKRIKIYLAHDNGNQTDFEIAIKATDGGTGKPTGADLATATIDKDLIANNVQALFEVIFSSPATLVSGTKYALVFRSVGGGNAQYYTKSDNSASYTNGDTYSSGDDGSSWSIDNSYDVYFETYVDSGSSVTIIEDGEIKEDIIVTAGRKIDGRDISVDGIKLDTIEEDAVSLPTVKADSDVSDAISKKHAQGTDQVLDTGGANEVGANELRETLDTKVIQKEPTGFPNITDSNISFDDGTRTFTIEPAVTSFDYYIKNTKYTKNSAQTVVISDTEGTHFIYFDGTTLTETTSFTTAIFNDYAYVAVLYWDATNDTAIYIGEERHGITMDWATHAYEHNTEGTRFISGLALGDFDADGDGSDDTQAQFSVASGVIYDEDLIHTIGALSAPAQIPVYYKEGAFGYWRKDTATDFPVKSFVGGGGKLAWNEFTGGSWTQTETPTTGGADCVLAHIFATNDIDNPIIAIQGQATYTSITAARTAAPDEINTLVTSGLPFQEFVPIGSVIFESNSTWTNTVKATVRTTSNGDNYIDLRFESLSPTIGSAGNHNNTTNRDTINSHPATAISLDTTNFNGILGSEDDVQEALETLDDAVNTKINEQSDNYTLVLTDNGKYVQMNKGTANNLTVPPNSSVAFSVGTTIAVEQTGAGQTTIVAGGGVTLNTQIGLKITGQYGVVSLIKTATDTWTVYGSLEA